MIIVWIIESNSSFEIPLFQFTKFVRQLSKRHCFITNMVYYTHIYIATYNAQEMKIQSDINTNLLLDSKNISRWKFGRQNGF